MRFYLEMRPWMSKGGHAKPLNRILELGHHRLSSGAPPSDKFRWMPFLMLVIQNCLCLKNSWL
ncbi:unnamed protein product [Brassica oleracea]